MTAKSGLRWLLFAVVLWLAGCQSYSQITENQKLDSVLYAYEKSMRWGAVENLSSFQQPELRKQQAIQGAPSVRVTGYRVLVPPVRDEEGRASQVALIQYMLHDSQVVREFRDEQLWQLDATDGNWYLVSPLPAFK